MAEFVLPELGENVASGEIVKIFVSVGDQLDVDTPILEVETDKAVIEVPSNVAGVVDKILVAEGDNVSPGQSILNLSEGGTAPEKAPEPAKSEASPEPVQTSSAPPETPQEMVNERIEFIIPEMGEDVGSGEVVKIFVSVGDMVSVDDPILEVETDKAVIEVPSNVSGVVEEILIQEGSQVATGHRVLSLSHRVPVKETEKVQASAAPATASPKATEKAASSAPAPSAVPSSPAVNGAGQTGANKFGILPNPSHKILYELAPSAPSVRRFAREIGIDIRQVPGSGPGGRISIDDVKKFAKAITQEAAQAKASPAAGGTAAQATGIAQRKLPDFSKFGEIERERMSNVRRATATHLSSAWLMIPHVTQFDKADITDLEKLRKQFGPKVEKSGGKLTVTAVLLKVMASALKVFPQFASSVDMDNQEIVYKQYAHIGVAVDTPRGLIVPVIRDVDKKNITQLSLELGELADKARRGKTSLDDMQGGVMTITNLGGIGGTSFTPVVNWPEVAILGVSRGQKEPIFIDGQFQPRLMLPLSLSYDHRVIDGADGARFLRWIVQALEEPFTLLLEG